MPPPTTTELCEPPTGGGGTALAPAGAGPPITTCLDAGPPPPRGSGGPGIPPASNSGLDPCSISLRNIPLIAARACKMGLLAFYQQWIVSLANVHLLCRISQLRG